MCQNQKNLLNSILFQIKNIINIVQVLKIKTSKDKRNTYIKNEWFNNLHDLLDIFTDIEQIYSNNFKMNQDYSQSAQQGVIQKYNEFTLKSYDQILGIQSQTRLNSSQTQYSQNYSQNNLKSRSKPSHRGPYRSYSLKEKQKILQLYQMGYKFASIHRMLGIPQKNIVRWCKNGVIRKKGAGRKVGDQDMEKNILKWIAINYQQGTKINMNLIRQRAKKFSTKKQFKSSKGWLKNFIKRHKINEKYSIQ